MDPRIWGRLPEELLDVILSLLSLPTILALRRTCKRFHSLLLSPSFLSLHHHHHSSSSPSPSFLLLCHPQFYRHRLLPLYDSSSSLWRTPPRSPLPPSLLLSTSAGLLCFTLPDSQHHPSLLVSNPITLSSRVIPIPILLPASSPVTLSLVPIPSAAAASSSSTHGYKIFLATENSNLVFVYDSLSLSWTYFAAHRRPILAGQDGVFFDGHLYFASREPFSVVGFNLATGTWSPLSADLPGGLAFVRLVGDGGRRLFLIAGVGADGISRSLRVWELVEGRKWEEAGMLPEMMCRKFVSVCYHNYAHVRCLWHEGLVCVGCTTWPEVLFFRVARGTWHWLPRCPLVQEKWSCGFRWFSFVLNLYATP